MSDLPKEVTQTGGSGRQLTSKDACEHIRFSNEELERDPSATRNGTKESWDIIQGHCPNIELKAPLKGDQVFAQQNEEKPGIEGDNSEQQGVLDKNVGSEIEPTPEKEIENPQDEPIRPPEGQPDVKNQEESVQKKTSGAEPVNLFSGQFYIIETDLEIANTLIPLSVTRYYRSGAGFLGPFGWNWDHNYNIFIRRLDDGSIALWRHGQEQIFKWNGQTFDSPRGSFEVLVKLSGTINQFALEMPQGFKLIFDKPVNYNDPERLPVVSMLDRHNNKLSFSYNSENKLESLQSDAGRGFNFFYDHCGLLVQISDKNGRTFNYCHDEELMHLTGTQSPATRDFPKGVSRIYHYGRFNLPKLIHNIVRVEDSEGNVYLENTYEEDPGSWSYSRVKKQLYGGYLFQLRYTQIQYVPDNPIYMNIPSVKVELMNPDYGLEVYTFNFRGELLDKRLRLNKDESFRVIKWSYKYDDQGNRIEETQSDGVTLKKTYDNVNPDAKMRGNLLSVEKLARTGFPAPSRIIWKGKYENKYQLLTEEQDELGSKTTYTYDFDINPGDPNNSGKLKIKKLPSTTLPDGSNQNLQVTYEHNNKGQVTLINNTNGFEEKNVYGNVGNLTDRLVESVVDPTGVGHSTKYLYNDYGFLTDVIDANTNSTKYVYNALGLLEHKIDPAINGKSSETSFFYNTDKKIIRVQRTKGQLNINEPFILDEIERDVFGYTTSLNLSVNTNESRKFIKCNDFRGNPLEIINPDGSVEEKVYDERGLLVRETRIGSYSDMAEMTLFYDRRGRIIKEVSPSGLVKEHTYDAFGRLLETSLSNGSLLLNEWGANDQLLSETIRGDNGSNNFIILKKVEYKYDERNRKVEETIYQFHDDINQSIKLTTQWFWGSNDKIQQKVDQAGAKESFIYDGSDRLSKTIDALGNEEHYKYDAVGNLLEHETFHKTPSGLLSASKKIYEYDERNRLIKSIDIDGTFSESIYDDRNLIIESKNSLGVSQKHKYDSFGNRIERIVDQNGLNIVHRWVFDNMSRLIKYQDPSSQKSIYEYDSLGRLLVISYPNGHQSKREYNPKGLIQIEELKSGIRFKYSYDNANRLISVKASNVPANVVNISEHKYTYDGLDRVVSASNGHIDVLRTYDSKGRILSEKNGTHIMQCEYDDLKHEVFKKWPNNRTEKHTHNLNGTLNQIERVLTNGANEIIVKFSPRGVNLLEKIELSNGVEIQSKHDERLRLSELDIKGANLEQKVLYRYDVENRRRVEAFEGSNATIILHDFDAKNRLINSEYNIVSPILSGSTQQEHNNSIATIESNLATSNFEEVFTYNNSDDRLSHSDTLGNTRSYSYLNGHKIQSDGSSPYGYFDDGSLKSRMNVNYQTDAFGRIIKVTEGIEVLLELRYDAFGRPFEIIEKNKPKSTLRYLGDFVEEEEISNGSNRHFTITPLNGEIIAYNDNDSLFFPIYDGRKNVLGVTDQNGELIESYTYKSFGEPTIRDNNGAIIAASNINFYPIFGGQRYLGSAGLYLSKKRLLSPQDGSYLSIDPSSYKDSPSLYVYAAQNPIDNIDPSGGAIPLIAAIFVIGGSLLGVGYSAHEAKNNPGKYEGLSGGLRVLSNVLGGAAIGGFSIVAGEAVLAMGGVGIFGSGVGSAGTSLGLTKSFLLYGGAGVAAGSTGRLGFHALFPDYVDQVSPGSVATDFALGGAGSLVFRGLSHVARIAANPVASLRQFMFKGQPIPHSMSPHLPNYMEGATDAAGNIYINSNLNLSANKLNEVLMHEGVHRFLTPLKSGRIHDLRRFIGAKGYRYSNLLKYLEEGLAQSVGSGSFKEGFRWISSANQMTGYSLSKGRILFEGAAFLGAAYLAYDKLNNLINNDGESDAGEGADNNESGTKSVVSK